MAENNAEQGPQFERATGSAENIRRLLKKDDDEAFYELGLDAEEVERQDISLQGESTMSAFLDALRLTWIRTDLGARFDDRLTAQPLATWGDGVLQDAYLAWSRYQPEDKNSKFAEARENVLNTIQDVAKQRGKWGFVVLGQEWEAKSARDLQEIKASDVKKANREVGQAFEDFLYDFKAVQSDKTSLLSIYQRWKVLQSKYGLREGFSQQEVDSLSVLERAAQKITETVTEKLRTLGVTDVAQAVQEHGATGQEPELPSASRGRPLADRLREGETKFIDDVNRRLEATLGQRREAEYERKARGETDPQWQKRPEAEARDLARRLAASNPGMEPERLVRIATADRPHIMQASGPEVMVDYSREDTLRSRGDEHDYRAVKREMMRTANWEDYDWSGDQKREAMQVFAGIVGEAGANEILAALLLHGRTGEEAQAIARRLGQSEDPRDTLTRYLNSLDILKDDTQVLKIVMPSSQHQNSFKEGLFQEEPNDIEELAWQMQVKLEKNFGEDGPYPILRRKVREEVVDKKTGKKMFVYRDRVDGGNMVMWFRERAVERHGLNSTTPLDFEAEVMLQKRYGAKVDVYSMLLGKDRMRSRYGSDGDDFGWMADHLEVEAILFTLPRSAAIEIVQGGYGDRKKMNELRLKYFADNNFSRPIGPKSMLAHLYGLGESVDWNPKEKAQDGKLGAMINRIELAYANIANPAELAKVLGLGTRAEDLHKLFNLNELRRVRGELLKDKGVDHDTYCDLRLSGKINGIELKKVFNPDGSPKLGTQKERLLFIRLINFYGYQEPHEQFKVILRQLISERAAAMHGLVTSINGQKVDFNRKYGEMIAYYNTWFLGSASRNDVLNAGYNAEAKASRWYRHKIAGREEDGEGGGRGGKHGSLWNMAMYKRWLITPTHVIRTNVVDPETGQTRTIHQAMEEAARVRAKIDMDLRADVEAMEAQGLLREGFDRKIATIMGLRGEELTDQEIRDAKEEVRRERMTEILKENPNIRRAYQQKTDEFIFKEQAMYTYAVNHYQKGVNIDERLQEAKDLRFDQYIVNTPLVGSTFNQEKWQEDMSKFITDVRYAFKETDINYDMMIWDWDPKLGEMRRMKMGESMFSDQLVNIKEFKTNGKVDWDKVNKNKKLLYKRWMECFIIAQMLQYRNYERWNTNPRYSFSMTEDILEAVGKIPGWVDLDDKNIKNTRVREYFFDKAAMKRIRKESGTTKFSVYGWEILNRGFFGTPGQDDGFFSGLGDLFGLIFGESVGKLATR